MVFAHSSVSKPKAQYSLSDVDFQATSSFTKLQGFMGSPLRSRGVGEQCGYIHSIFNIKTARSSSCFEASYFQAQQSACPINLTSFLLLFFNATLSRRLRAAPKPTPNSHLCPIKPQTVFLAKTYRSIPAPTPSVAMEKPSVLNTTILSLRTSGEFTTVLNPFSKRRTPWVPRRRSNVGKAGNPGKSPVTCFLFGLRRADMRCIGCINSCLS
jgi:hypothetical protein